ncbi:serine/threonine-protein kinase Bck1p/SLK1/SSP31 [Trichomonascus vanleenenianus]|uniref:mitogen-activated protein kinase kinase kinase BCK1 n=1 Tax=Trichomonascus vanleenenianus TaxID=2268995 RepID=UPI003EC9F785
MSNYDEVPSFLLEDIPVFDEATDQVSFVSPDSHLRMPRPRGGSMDRPANDHLHPQPLSRHRNSPQKVPYPRNSRLVSTPLPMPEPQMYPSTPNRSVSRGIEEPSPVPNVDSASSYYTATSGSSLYHTAGAFASPGDSHGEPKPSQDRMALNAPVYNTNNAMHPLRFHHPTSPQKVPKTYRSHQELRSDFNAATSPKNSTPGPYLPGRKSNVEHPRQLSGDKSGSLRPATTTVSWNANDPNEWTMERVVYFLEVNRFGPDWVHTFARNNICGEAFLAMSNYQNLKKLGHFYTKSEEYESSPSRFLHILRKLLNKTSSTTSADMQLYVDTSNTAVASDTEASEVSPIEIGERKYSDASIPPRLRPGPSDVSRPSSIFESTGKMKLPSPSSPSFRPPGFLRRHNKSSSSESSFMFPNSSTSNLPDDERSPYGRDSAVETSSDSTKKRGFLGKLRRRDHHHKSSSRDDGYHSSNRLESPTSPNALMFDRPIKGDTIDPKYRPVRISKITKMVLVTVNNDTFTVVNISEATTIDDVKNMIASELNIVSWAGATFHLTDFGHTQGEALSDHLLSSVLYKTSDLIKLYIGLPSPTKLTPSPGLSADSDQLNKYPTTPQYMIGATATTTASGAPSTVSEREKDKPVDYFSARPGSSANSTATTVSNTKSTDSLRVPLAPISSTTTATSSQPPAGTNTAASSAPASTTNTTSATATRNKTAPNLSVDTRAADDSFKVIRPEKRVINFDDRRASPYDRKAPDLSTPVAKDIPPPITESPTEDTPTLQYKPSLERRSSNLVALRAAPPPPLGRKSSIRRVTSNGSSTIVSDKVTVGTRSASYAPRREKITIQTDNLEVPGYQSLNVFSPGQSETLIPKPYVSRKQTVARKPVSGSTSPATLFAVSATNLSGSQEPEFYDFTNDNDDEDDEDEDDTLTTSNRPGAHPAFVENFISFEGAPAFEDMDDDSDSDGGLWAKKPIDQSKPKTPTASTSEAKQTIYSSQLSPLKSPLTDEENWAVRPPAEVVYDNLEQFFPDTDLDKPIIDDAPLSPPLSPLGDKSDNRLSYTRSRSNSFVPDLSPVAEPKNSMRSVSGSTSGGISPIAESASERDSETSGPRIYSVPLKDDSTPSSSGTGHATSTSSGSGSTVKRRRMKSIRVVAREASEARKKFSAAANSKNDNSGALLRRKSTKLWGQKLIEVKPDQLKNISTLRDQKGEYKQFVWVKGELIGKGTFGKVYLALNATTGEMMAVKQVEVPQTASDKANARQKEVIEALHSEVETLKDLDHLNIVQYLGFEANADVYNMFLEYVPGGSVGRVLQMHGRFEEQIIQSLTCQVLEGLSYLHSCGILHRDLKADNLLLDLDGVCKISDFGISKKSRDIYANDAEMSMQGTIFWMAPEVIHNVVQQKKQGYSAKIDIWSLGCVVLEMFAGRRPWSTDEAIGAMYKLGTSRQAPPIPEDTKPYVSSLGRDFLDQCFRTDPSLRPTAQQLLKHAFCRVPDGFSFVDTNLGKMINSKKKEPPKRRNTRKN